MNFNFENITGEDCYNFYKLDYKNRSPSFIYGYFNNIGIFKYDPIGIKINYELERVEISFISNFYKTESLDTFNIKEINVKLLKYRENKYLVIDSIKNNRFKDDIYILRKCDIYILRVNNITDEELNKVLMEIYI